jgi:hypothetical protein
LFAQAVVEFVVLVADLFFVEAADAGKDCARPSA